MIVKEFIKKLSGFDSNAIISMQYGRRWDVQYVSKDDTYKNSIVLRNVGRFRRLRYEIDTLPKPILTVEELKNILTGLPSEYNVGFEADGYKGCPKDVFGIVKCGSRMLKGGIKHDCVLILSKYDFDEFNSKKNRKQNKDREALVSKRLSRTNVFKIKYHFVGDSTNSMLFTSKSGSSNCDALNELMVSVKWQPFIVESIWEE